MYKKAIAFALLLAFSTPVFAQALGTQPPKHDPAELRKEAIAFLRETMGDVQNMRTLENRISFSSELAGLMWYHDEQEARTMFNAAMSDFRELISRLDAQMMAFPEENDSEASLGMMPFMEASDRRKFEMKYRVAMAVRQQIASSIAEHDPDVALNFFYDTASTNPKTASFGGRDTQFELNLLKEIAMKSPAKALQFGVKSLDKGFDYQHVDLLRQIYGKDTEVGIEFGQKILSKVKGTTKDVRDYAVNSLIEFGISSLESSKSAPDKKPVYTEPELRDLVDVLAQEMLRPSETMESGYALRFASTIAKISPTKASQIRAKYRSPKSASNTGYGGAPPPSAPRVVNTSGNANVMITDGGATAAANSYDAQRSAEDKLMSDVQRISKGELPKEEREKVIAQSRKILMQNKSKNKQIMGLSMLAAQVAKAGDKDLAASIMRDAEALVNPQPKNYQDFMYTWMLASGYAEADADKAFPILESAIGRANDLISAFVKVGEFIDVTEEMISDGEAQVGAFGGGMIRGLSRELGVAEATLITLVRADFAKTRALTNRFDRPEVRILAKMLVLRSVLGKNAGPESPEAQVKKVIGQN